MRLWGENFQAPLPRRCLRLLSTFLQNTPIKKKIINCEILNMYWRRSTALLNHCTPLNHYYLLALLFLFSTHLLCLYFDFRIFSTVLPSLTVSHASHSPAAGCRASVPRDAPTAVLALPVRCGRGFSWCWGDTRRLSSCSQLCLGLFLLTSLPPRLVPHPAPP